MAKLQAVNANVNDDETIIESPDSDDVNEDTDNEEDTEEEVAEVKRTTTAVLLPNILAEHVKALLTDGQTLTDYVKMAVARKSNFDVALLPVTKKRSTLPTFYSAEKISALVAANDTSAVMSALASNAAREAKIKENLKIARDDKKAKKASPVVVTTLASFDDYGMPMAM